MGRTVLVVDLDSDHLAIGQIKSVPEAHCSSDLNDLSIMVTGSGLVLVGPKDEGRDSHEATGDNVHAYSATQDGGWQP